MCNNRYYVGGGETLPKFFVDPGAITGNQARLIGDQARHASVLRLRPGDGATLSCGDGMDYLCTISEISAKDVFLNIAEAVPCRTEPAVRCTVYMAFSKAEKLELVIQKATELGAAEIVAFPSARCVSRPDERSLSRKLERWQRIAAAAAEQSGRGSIPAVTTAKSFSEALGRAANADLPIFFYENETGMRLHTLLAGSVLRAVSLMTGPEGGFTSEEAKSAETAGLVLCSLGPRILRCETAPLCALSALMLAAGEV